MSEFKKGDYIVFFEATQWSDAFPENYIFKQKYNSNHLNPEIDGNGSTNNGWECFRHFEKIYNGKEDSICDWRYATDLEAAEYERLGKPFDVTTLKPKFEVGKWYKNLGSDNKYIVKFKEIKNRSFYSESGTYYIYDGKAELEDSGGNITGNYKDAIECNLSEIQQYLPEGHVDKIKTKLTIDDLVEGEIYVQKEKYLFKYNSTKAISLEGNCYLKNWKSNGFFGTWSILRPANSSERQWLEVCIKADKFVPKDEALNNEFVLPERWCVKTTIETRSVVNKFLNSNKYDGELSWDYYCHYPLIGMGSAWETVQDGYAEITFDQFKKYVLKDEAVEPKQLELELNKWYNYNKCLVCYQGVEGDIIKGYGFLHGDWSDTVTLGSNPEEWTKASQEEVEARLIEYAKKKYPVGCSVKYIAGNYIGKNSDSKIKHKLYSFKDNELKLETNRGGDTIFKDGIWAEVIKEEVKVNSKRAIKFESQAEWDFANKKFKYGNSFKINESTDSFGKCNYRMVNDGAVLSEGYANDQNYGIISFQQWLDEFGNNETWSKMIDVDFGEVKPAFKVGDWVVVVSNTSKCNSKKNYPIGLVAQIANKRWQIESSNGGYWTWLGLNGKLVDNNNAIGSENFRHAKLSEIEDAKRVIHRETVGNVGLKKITQTSFNRDFYVKVNSQEEVDAMFEYLESQGERVGVCKIGSNNKIAYGYGLCRWIATDYDVINDDDYDSTHERPLSDFITIPASTNDLYIGGYDLIESNLNQLGTIRKNYEIPHHGVGLMEQIKQIEPFIDKDSYEWNLQGPIIPEPKVSEAEDCQPLKRVERRRKSIKIN